MTVDAVETFMKYDYAEMKDLLKTFITLVSASIVFSLTFSDKIVKFDNAANRVKRVIVLAWWLMILSLITGGASLFLIACAAGKLIYGSIPLVDISASYLEYFSVLMSVIAGGTYVLALVTLIVAVARGISDPHRAGT